MDKNTTIDTSKITVHKGTVKKTMEEDGIDVEHGFDRGLDFTDIKNRLIREYDNLTKQITEMDVADVFYTRKRKMMYHKIIYCITSLIQLRNGSRISEACVAFKKFINTNIFDGLILVKIAKSAGLKYKRSTKTMYESKARYRKMMFPNDWIKIDDVSLLGKYLNNIPNERLQKRVLDYLRKYFECNTHSLRYAFINYMIYTEKQEPYLIAKFVGHVNTAQLITYTQQKNCDKLFEKDI